MWPFGKKNGSAALEPMPPQVAASHSEVAPQPVTDAGLSPADSVQASALITRWDQEIAQIAQDFQAELDAAVAGSQPIIDVVTTDLQPLARPWHTIKARMHKVTEKISDTWDEISDEMSALEGFTHEMIMTEGNKRDDATFEIELANERVFNSVMAQASQRMLDHALVQDASMAPCQNCAAPMDKVLPVAESLNVECGYCMAMNTVNPGDAIRVFAHSGASYLAQQHCRPTLEAYLRVEQKMKHFRDDKDVPLEMLIDFEKLNREYWTARLNLEASYVPEQKKYVESKIERHLADANKTLRRYWQWREHVGSRPPV